MNTRQEQLELPLDQYTPPYVPATNSLYVLDMYQEGVMKRLSGITTFSLGSPPSLTDEDSNENLTLLSEADAYGQRPLDLLW